MITATIQNNLTVAIGAGTVYPLPPPFDWATIGASPATMDFLVKTQDLMKVVNQTTGFTAGDMLQDMIQKGRITVTYAAATTVDTEGTAIVNET